MTYNRLGPRLFASDTTGDLRRYADYGTFYSGAPKTIDRIPGGWYVATSEGLVRTTLDCDALHEDASTDAIRLIAEAKAFWTAADTLIARGLNARRGLLLYGPPGTGKTSLITLLAARAVEDADAIVLSGRDPDAIERSLKLVRSREPARPILLVIEDIEETYRGGQSQLLSLLDGHAKVDRVFTVATTNDLDALDGRLVDRPGRFDRIVEIGPPDAAARRAFLERTAPELDAEALDRWVAQSDGWTVAHLRELVISVLALGQKEADVVDRLRRPTKTSSGGVRRHAALTHKEAPIEDLPPEVAEAIADYES